MNTLRHTTRSLVLWGIGCTLSVAFATSAWGGDIPMVTWDTTLGNLRVDSNYFVGQRLTFRCPRRDLGKENPVLSGTDIYTSDSALCFAAVHAGMMGTKGGVFTVQLIPGANEYIGSERHGIVSGDFPKTRRSLVFVSEKPMTRLTNIQRLWAPRLRGDTKFTLSGLAHRNLVGQRFILHCPPASQDMNPLPVYGTDDYAFDSFVCPAAMHAGRMTYQGGFVCVRIDKSSSDLRGSIRNGIESRDGGSGLRAISFPPLESSGCPLG